MTTAQKILRKLPLAVLLAGLSLPVARATTIRPPDFAGLVQHAEQVVEAEVLAVEGRLGTTADGRRVIHTWVTFAVRDTIAGAPTTAAGNTLQLRFLGGQVDDLVFKVDAMPQFKVGSEVVLFVQDNGRAACPLVAWGHGKYLIDRDPVSGVRTIARANAEPLTALAAVQEPLDDHGHSAHALPAATGALSLDTFKLAIQAEKERQQANVR